MTSPGAAAGGARRESASDALRWAILFGVNSLGILPWWHVEFTTVDLAAIVFDVGRLRAGYVPYRDTFNHHFVGYLLPFYCLGTLVQLSPVVLKLCALSCNFAASVCIFLIVRDVAHKQAAWIAALLTVTVGWFLNWQGYAFNVQSGLALWFALLLLLVVRACTRSGRGCSSRCSPCLCCSFQR